MDNRFFKLNLNGCIYWQSEVVNEKKVFTKMEHISRKENLLNEIFLKKISDTDYMEIESKKVLKVENGIVEEPKGIVIPLSNLTPCSYMEFASSFNNINKLGLANEYKKIINDLLFFSQYCEKAQEKKENSLSLTKRY